VVQAVIQVIIYECLLGFAHRAFGRLQLLRYVQARAPCFDHFPDTAQLSLGASEPLEDLGVCLVNVRGGHALDLQILYPV
jgi:hypothetical protein